MELGMIKTEELELSTLTFELGAGNIKEEKMEVDKDDTSTIPITKLGDWKVKKEMIVDENDASTISITKFSDWKVKEEMMLDEKEYNIADNQLPYSEPTIDLAKLIWQINNARVVLERLPFTMLQRKYNPESATHEEEVAPEEQINDTDAARKHRAALIKRYCPTCDTLTVDTVNPGHGRPCSTCRTAYHYICGRCNKRYGRLHSLIYHLDSRCDPTKRYDCPQCNYRTSARDLINKHQKRCKGVSRLRCQYCTATTQSPEKMRKHMLTKHLDVVASMRNRRKAMDKEEKKRTIVEKLPELIEHRDGNLREKANNDTFVNIATQEKVDNELREAHCPQCRKTETVRGLSKRCQACAAHLLLQCKMCQKRISRSHNLKKHERVCGNRRTHCQLCDFKSNFPANVTRHVKQKHSNQ